MRLPKGLFAMPSPYPARGFTLVELLTVITIVSLLMAASLGSIRTASRSLEIAHANSENNHGMRITADFLRRQFSQLVPAETGSKGKERLIFRGEEHGVQFVAPGPRKSFGAGLMIYALESIEEGGASALMLRYAPLDPGSADPDQRPMTQGMLLSDSFSTVLFDYYGSAAKNEPPRWRGQWPAGSDRHPDLVRLKTRLESADSPGWPDLVFRIQPVLSR